MPKEFRISKELRATILSMASSLHEKYGEAEPIEVLNEVLSLQSTWYSILESYEFLKDIIPIEEDC